MQCAKTVCLQAIFVLLLIRTSKQCDTGPLLLASATVQDSTNSSSRSAIIADLIPKRTGFKITITNKNIPELCYNSFDNFTHLHTLKIESSELQEILPGSLVHLPALRLISFSNNKIEVIEESVFNNLSITHLYLERNNIRYIYDNAFNDMRNLSFLDLSSNKINYLNSNWFKGCEKLARLNLEENEIKNIPENAFQNLLGKHLYENGDKTVLSIILTRNKIFRIHPHAFKNLEGLDELNLEENEISMIDDNVFKHFAYFRLLNLGYNKLNCISESVLKAFENFVDNNPWDCKCLKKIEEFAIAKKVNVHFEFAQIQCKQDWP